jgi:serine/threonine-protein kinase
MNEQPPPGSTADLPASDPALDAGLAAAFGPDSGPPLPAVPRICLRQPLAEPDTPVLQVRSAEVPGPQQAPGHYRIDGEIARGGMGAVLKGRDTDLGRDVAVKVLLAAHASETERVQRFVEEAQIAGQLQHPGVVPVYELGRFADHRPYFAMKLVKGRTLAALLAESKEPAEDRPRFVGVFEQVCQTLAYAHARGVIHRDLKPANVMVGAFGEVQVMDWGLAKVLPQGGVADERQGQPRPETSVIRTARSAGPGSDGEPDSPTQAGSVLGTPAYMAPEQARGDVGLVDERADVFGLGAILCEVLTGQPPFTGKTAEAMRKAQAARLDDAHARLDACGAEAELVALARRCLAAEPWDRPRHAGQVAEAVTAYRHSVAERLRQAELARAAAQVQAAEERKRRRLVLALAATVLALVGLTGTGAWWLARSRDATERAVLEACNDARVLRARAEASGDLPAWKEALSAARRADGLLAGGPASADLVAQVRNLLGQVAEETERVETEAAQAERDRRLRNRLTEVRTGDEGFAEADTDADYLRAFREYGLDVDTLPAERAAERLRARPAGFAVAVAAELDVWALKRRKQHRPGPDWQRLLALARAADPDPWRDTLRQLAGASRPIPRDTLLELARRADVDRLQPTNILLLALTLRDVGESEAAERLLRQGQLRHPADVWLNYELAFTLQKRRPPRLEEAVRFYTAARAVRPEFGHALAHALEQAGRIDEAVAQFREMSRLQPRDARQYNCLGIALSAQGKLDEAIDALRKALALRPDNARVHSNLGSLLFLKGARPEAVAHLEKAVALGPDDAEARYNLGHALLNQGRVDPAIALFKKAIALDPHYFKAYFNLGLALEQKGQFADALAALREGQERVSGVPVASAEAAEMVKACERLADLDARLPAVLRGEFKPADAVEQRDLARLCQRFKRRYAAAARLYADAFAARPRLAEDLRTGDRYNAACAAALAGCGRGEDAANLGTKERASWRGQALAWLRTDLERRSGQLQSGKPEDRAEVLQHLRHWQVDTDLAGLREEDAVAKLPGEEQEACRKLWADVTALLAKAEPKK